MSFIKIVDERNKSKKVPFDDIAIGSAFLYEGNVYEKISAVLTSSANTKYMNLETKTYKEVMINCVSVEDGIQYYLPYDSLVEPVKCKLIIEG